MAYPISITDKIRNARRQRFGMIIGEEVGRLQVPRVGMAYPISITKENCCGNGWVSLVYPMRRVGSSRSSSVWRHLISITDEIVGGQRTKEISKGKIRYAEITAKEIPKRERNPKEGKKSQRGNRIVGV